jgi:hypothetical protein
MSEIDWDRMQPLRLMGGSWKGRQGNGCAMEVISYITGEIEITDYPACSHPLVARIVQQTNDHLAALANPSNEIRVSGSGEVDWSTVDANRPLRPEDAISVIDLGMLTVGTADIDDEILERWVRECMGMRPEYTNNSIDAAISDFPDTTHQDYASYDWAKVAVQMTLHYARPRSIFPKDMVEERLRAYRIMVLPEAKAWLLRLRDMAGLDTAPEADKQRLTETLKV